MTSPIKSGERRTATIVFADMKGFTSLSERMDPEEMDSVMSAVFGAFEEIIRANGGTVEKYIGDALVAVFGVPQVHEDDPRRAVESAMAFLDRKGAIAGSLGFRNEELRFRVGVHEGLVATGQRGEFDVVTGHAMAIAQRVQDAAEPDGILVTDPVREQTEAFFQYAGPITVRAKGKTDTISAWALSGLASAGRESGPFVGRKDILDELLRAYIKDDGSTLCGRYLTGEAGVGKSRLAAALAERVRAFPGFNAPVLSVRAQKYRQVRFSVPADLLAAYLGLKLSAGQNAFDAAMAALPGVDPAEATRVATIFTPSGSSRSEADSSLSLFTVFQAILDRLGQSIYPALFVIDDATAMDKQSREFLAYLFHNARVKPFVIMAGRDHPQALREAFPELKAHKLGPLPADEAKALALALWPECPDSTMDMILSQAGGNPLFIREYTLFASKNQDLSSLPASIQTMFMTSLERYPPQLRDFLRIMSAFLVSFTEEDAERVLKATGGDPTVVPGAISRFVKEGILTPWGDKYRFTVEMLKKALYAGLLNHNKRIIHGAIADIMATRSNPNRLRHMHHLMRAERWAEAAQIMLKDPARNYRFEYLEHVEALYKRLSKQAPELAAQLLIAKSALFFNAGRLDEAGSELKRIMALAVESRDDGCMGFAYHLSCSVSNMGYAFQKAQFTGQKALYYYRRSGMSARSIQNVVRAVAFSEIMRNNFEEARALVDGTEALADRDPLEYASSRAEFRLFSGDYRGALSALSGLDPIAQACSENDYEAVTRFFGNDLRLKILWQLCDFPALAKAASALFEAGSLNAPAMAQAHAMAAAAASVAGNRQAQADGFARAAFFADQARNDLNRIDILRTMALCAQVAGDHEQAERWAREGAVMGLRHSSYYPTFTILMVLVALAHRRGNLDEARFFLTEASYFLTTGLLLPYKDVILYYYYSGVLGPADSAERSLALAKRLLDDEKKRLGKPELVDALLRVRGFAMVEDQGKGKQR